MLGHCSAAAVSCVAPLQVAKLETPGLYALVQPVLWPVLPVHKKSGCTLQQTATTHYDPAYILFGQYSLFVWTSLSGIEQRANFLRSMIFSYCRQSSAKSPNTSQTAIHDESLLAQAGTSLQQPQPTLRNAYSRNELLDIAEVWSCRQSSQLQS